MTTIVTSTITGLCVAIPSILATVISSRNNSNLLSYRLKKLEEKVEKHNHVIERTYKIESQIAMLEEEFKSLERR